MVVDTGVTAVLVPFSVAYLIGDSLYYCTAKPYVDDRRQRKSFYERVLTKGIERPDDDEAGCVCVVDKSCVNRKYEEKKMSGLLPKLDEKKSKE